MSNKITVGTMTKLCKQAQNDNIQIKKEIDGKEYIIEIRPTLTLTDVTMFSEGILTMLFNSNEKTGEMSYAPERYPMYLGYFLLCVMGNVNRPIIKDDSGEDKIDLVKMYDWVEAFDPELSIAAHALIQKLDTIADKKINQYINYVNNAYAHAMAYINTMNMMAAMTGQSPMMDTVKDIVMETYEKSKQDNNGANMTNDISQNVVEFPAQEDKKEDDAD